MWGSIMSQPGGMILLFGTVSHCLAQRSESACDRIEKAITLKSPQWTIVRKSNFACKKMSYFKLRSGKELVYVFIFRENSIQEATNTFKYFAFDDTFYGFKVDILGN
jgi:hypothetical protein